ncbi:MAG: 50S ribosomal protein L30 [Chloroflexota bacterium]
MAKKTAPKTLRVTLIKSPIGYTKDQKATVRALGLRRMNQTVEHTDTPALRGMLFKVEHLLRVEE